MDNYFAIIEIQINDGIPASPPVVFTEDEQTAQGELYAKLGYAYQNHRDYTAVIILDEKGHNITTSYGMKPIVDNRNDKTSVYSFVKIQGDEENLSADSVDVRVGDDAQSVIMQEYFRAIQDVWNEKYGFTETVVIDTEGKNFKMDVIDFTNNEKE